MMSDHPNELGSLKKAQSPSAPEPTPKKAKSARTRAREFAVQALYQRIVGGCDLPTIHKTVGALFGFHKADLVFFDAILTGVISQAAQLDELIAPYLDRPMSEISPVEHVVLWIGAYELQNCLDVPWRVVLNETVELTKIFGGPDGHKYVNGVLNQLAHSLRPVEIKAQ